MSDGADDLAVRRDLGAVGLVVEQGLGDAGDGERVEDARHHGEDEQGAQPGPEQPGGVA